MSYLFFPWAWLVSVETESYYGASRIPAPPVTHRQIHSCPQSARLYLQSSECPNWFPPSPHPQASVALPIFGSKEGEGEGRGGRGSQFRRRDRQCGTLGLVSSLNSHPTSSLVPSSFRQLIHTQGHLIMIILGYFLERLVIALVSPRADLKVINS
jgi:hypothetical protein